MTHVQTTSIFAAISRIGLVSWLVGWACKIEQPRPNINVPDSESCHDWEFSSPTPDDRLRILSKFC